MKKILLLILLLTYGNSFLFGQESNPNQPIGKLVNIGGRNLHVIAVGEGRPTVVLMAGGGAYAIDWALVQPKVANLTRVLSYDRAGLGWSDSGPKDETVEQTVSDLHKLLKKNKEKGPFILVGASISGIYITAYQKKYPKEVAGIIFSNCANKVGLKTKTKEGLVWELTESEIASNYPLPVSLKDKKPTFSIRSPFDKLPENLQKIRVGLDEKNWEAFEPTKFTAAGLLSWRKEFLKIFHDTEAGKPFAMGNWPVIVLAEYEMPGDSVRNTRDRSAPRLSYLSSNTLHIKVPKGHEIHLYNPAILNDAIEKLIIAVRNKTPLR